MLRLTMTETLLHMVVSMVLAIVLIFLCRGLIEDLLAFLPRPCCCRKGPSSCWASALPYFWSRDSCREFFSPGFR